MTQIDPIREKVSQLEEKLLNDMRERMGTMMDDEELKAIVHRGVERILFEKRRTYHKHGGYTDSKDSLIEELLREALRPALQEAVSCWVVDNPEKVQAAIEKIITDNIGQSLLNALSAVFGKPLLTLHQQMVGQAEELAGR